MENDQKDAFIKLMNLTFEQLKTDNLSANGFMKAMDSCFQMTITDFRFAYLHLREKLIELAPNVDRETYLRIGQSVVRIASYMQRFEIPNAKLPSIWEIVEQHQHLNRE